MKRVGIVCGSLSRGGAERVTIHLAEYLNKNGVNTDIITVDKVPKEYTTSARRIMLNSNELNTNLLLNSIMRIIKLPLEIHRLRAHIKKYGYELILIMGVTNTIVAIPATRFLKVKTVISERNSPEHFDGKWITKILSRWLMKYGDGFVFQTEEAMMFHSKRVHNKGTVIFNPLFIKDYPERSPEKKEKCVVTAGRLAEQKNHKLLLQAFSTIKPLFPEYRLLIYGDGPLKSALLEYSESLGISDVVDFPGNVEDLHSRIVNASCFVLSSDYEGMPNALIEAMALGIPCISTDCPCGGPKCLIENWKNGVLVPVGDSINLADAMIKVLSDAKLQEELSSNAYEIRRTLDAERIGKQWKDYLESICLS